MNYQTAKITFYGGDITDPLRLLQYYRDLLNSDDSVCRCRNCGLININTGVTATADYDGTYYSFNCNNCNTDGVEFY